MIEVAPFFSLNAEYEEMRFREVKRLFKAHTIRKK